DGRPHDGASPSARPRPTSWMKTSSSVGSWWRRFRMWPPPRTISCTTAPTARSSSSSRLNATASSPGVTTQRWTPGSWPSDAQPQRRLVEEEDLRVGDEAAAEVHLLAQAGRQLADLGVGAVVQAGDGEHAFDALLRHGPGDAVELREEPEVFADGEQAVAGRL